MVSLLASPQINKLSTAWPRKMVYIPFTAPCASDSVFQKDALEISLTGARLSSLLHELLKTAIAVAITDIVIYFLITSLFADYKVNVMPNRKFRDIGYDPLSVPPFSGFMPL